MGGCVVSLSITDFSSFSSIKKGRKQFGKYYQKINSFIISLLLV